MPKTTTSHLSPRTERTIIEIPAYDTNKMDIPTLAECQNFLLANAQGCFFCSVAAFIIYIPIAFFCSFICALRAFLYALVSTHPLSQVVP